MGEKRVRREKKEAGTRGLDEHQTSMSLARRIRSAIHLYAGRTAAAVLHAVGWSSARALSRRARAKAKLQKTAYLLRRDVRLDRRHAANRTNREKINSDDQRRHGHVLLGNLKPEQQKKQTTSMMRSEEQRSRMRRVSTASPALILPRAFVFCFCVCACVCVLCVLTILPVLHRDRRWTCSC